MVDAHIWGIHHEFALGSSKIGEFPMYKKTVIDMLGVGMWSLTRPLCTTATLSLIFAAAAKRKWYAAAAKTTTSAPPPNKKVVSPPPPKTHHLILRFIFYYLMLLGIPTRPSDIYLVIASFLNQMANIFKHDTQDVLGCFEAHLMCRSCRFASS